MLVCNKCFRPKCNCNESEKVEIDDGILDSIRILNEKGYITEFCCSGHKENTIFQCYIMFKNKEHFLDLPNGFTLYKKGKAKGNKLLEYIDKEWNKKSETEKESIMIDVWYKLFVWCKKLPNKNECFTEWD